MKKFIPYVIIIFSVATMTNNVYAQKISKTKQSIVEYAARLTSNESPVKQMVHERFASGNEITVIDFTNTLTKESSAYKSSLQKYLKAENIFSINNANAFMNAIAARPEALTVIFPYKNKQLVIDLVAADIFADNFKIFTDKNPEGFAKQTSAFYRGIIRGANASASISFFEGQVEGYIILNNKTTVEITKISGSNASNQHAIYDDADILVKAKAHYCNILNPPGAELQKQYVNYNNNRVEAAQLKCVTNFWETAYSLYQHLGTTAKVSAFVTSLFNVYATLYANEKISMKLNASYIWTTQDPYNDNLTTFSNQRRNFGANTAVLLSDGAYGGVAWLNTICYSSDQYRHAFCGSINLYEDVLPITSYSWPVMVTCHEVGHNLGSPHTHACAWNGNNTAIDGCGPAAGYSEGCNGPIPATGGTVMSYCHLLSVGINLIKGFGIQPGDLIRHNVDSCITLTCPRITKACNPPGNVTASQITTKNALLKWYAVKDAAYYYINISADSGATFTLAADHLYSTSFKLTGLKSNVNYICDIWVSCAAGTYNSTRIYFTTPLSFADDYYKVIADAFKVMPNPVHDNRFIVTLKKGYENALVEIVSSSNQIIYQSRGNNAIRSFIAPQTKGLYYIRVTTDDKVMSEKILVE